jgi:ubiquinone/menaquinone biosynthesis C-methylase UbiE
LTGEILEVEPAFDACLKIFSEKCKTVLDFGCGTGDILFQCKKFGNLSYGMGIDLAKQGIDYAGKMVNLNHIRNMDFVTGDVSLLTQMEEKSFDGIIISNVLDTVPQKDAMQILEESTRLLKNQGLMFIKLNPDYSSEILKHYGYTNIRGNLYQSDGILRLRRMNSASWKELFQKKFEIIRYLEFPYPWQPGMNRLFLLRKLL